MEQSTSTQIENLGSRVAEAERDRAGIKLRHAELSKDVASVKGTTDRIEEKMDKFIDGAETRYAPMITWQVVKFAGAALGAGILGAFLSTILIK